MPRLVMVAFVAALLIPKGTIADVDLEPQGPSCLGLPISHFESRFPAKIKRITFDNAMLEMFLELWRDGSRPDLPRRPERVVIYALPDLPLVIGYQERHCIIAYLAIDSAALSRWLHQRLGWNT